ncbi:MAG: hypothetical protein K6B46_00490 [Opitutales bacterium]|nr:hypothetical protein [Opitutales bacterium]
MLFSKNPGFRSRKPFRRFFAFTLIEILTVVAIIGLVAVVIVGLKPGNPRGMDDACKMAGMEFRIAQAQAVRGTNPDRDPDNNKRYNVRAAVLVLNDEEDPDNHLRRLQTVVGGTDDIEKTDLSDYYWYAVGEPVILPDNIYFVEPNAVGITTRSIIKPLEGSEEVALDPTTEIGGCRAGSGKKRWYAYYFDGNGQTYMTKATFMIAKGAYIPGTGVRFETDTPAQGFVITRNGSIIFTRDSDEAEIASE